MMPPRFANEAGSVPVTNGLEMLHLLFMLAFSWHCSVPLLPDYQPPSAGGAAVGEAVSYLYVGSKYLHSDYGVDASFVAPLDGRLGWYDSGIHFAPYAHRSVSVQIEISRWQRFDYRPHLALAWGALNGTQQYKDLGLMLSNGPHRLGMWVRGDRLEVTVDGRSICSTRASFFVTPRERKFFQIRTETGVEGANGRATVSSIRLKTDNNAVPLPYLSGCIMHRNGIAWTRVGANAFAARGAFYPGEGMFFTGLDPATQCRP